MFNPFFERDLVAQTLVQLIRPSPARAVGAHRDRGDSQNVKFPEK
jgi:hypothetical protein